MCKDCAKVEKKERDNRSARHVVRFSNAVAGLLLDWVRLHQDNPYPNAVEKATLQELTGLDSKQLNTWFANYRRRRPAKKDGSAEPTTQSATSQTSLTKNDVNADPHPEKGSEKSGHQDVISLVKPQQRMFQCTFCTDTFATKFEWTRHETSLHLPLKRFICCPFAPIQKSVDTGTEICAYCGLVSPDPEHIASHNHDYCQSRDPDARIFLRKDHLRQHLRSVHECDMLAHMDHWLLEAVWVNSRCGFCGDRFSIWSERNEHLAGHFRNGYHMDLFKKAYSLDVLAFFTEDMAQAPAAEDLEVYHDL
ncbi:hypothetical protein D6D25_05395, partial [Aureobasidium pullulans]